MRTTVTIDDYLVDKARSLTNIPENGALVRAAFEALIHAESSRRLAALAGTDPGASAASRRRNK